MMIKLIKGIALCCLIVSGHTNASLIQTDYLNNGDNKLVFDNSAKLEWLRLDFNIGSSLDSMLNNYSGFRLANREEVGALFDQVFSGNYPFTFGLANVTNLQVDAEIAYWKELFGMTSVDAITKASYGFYSNGTASNVTITGFSEDLSGNFTNLYLDFNEFTEIPPEIMQLGTYMLVRDVKTVSEPISLTIVLLGLLCVALLRYKAQLQ